MRRLSPILVVPLLMVGVTSLLRSQGGEKPPSTSSLARLSRCETTEPSPRTAGIALAPNVDAAEQDLRRRLLADPSDVSIQFELATLFEARRDFPAALIALQEALKLDSTCSDCVLALSSLLFHCKQNLDSITVVEAFLETNPRSAPAVTHLALLQMEQQRYEEGLRLARLAQKLEKDKAIGFHLQALAHLGLNQADEAEVYFKMAIERDESMADPHLQLGLLYAGQPETLSSAALHLRKAVDLGLEHPQVYNDLGRVLVRQDQHRDAVEMLQKALAISPDYPDPYYLLSKSYGKLGQKAQEEAALKRFRALEAIQDAPSETRARARVHYENAMRLLQQRNRSQAYAVLMKVIEIDDAADAAYFRLAQLSVMSDLHQEAVEWVRKAIAVNPVLPEYHILLGESLPKTEAEAAIAAVVEAIRLNPSVATHYNSLGNIQFADGRYEHALQSYRQAIRLDDENPIFHLNLSSVLKQTGDEQASKRERELYFRLSAAQKNRNSVPRNR